MEKEIHNDDEILKSDPFCRLTFNGKTNSEMEEEAKMGTKRRRLTAEYKLRILKEVDICKGQPGAVGALLRKEGLYFSVLSQWRKQRDQGALSAMSEKRGPRPKPAKINLEIQNLMNEKARLEERLRQAELIIDLQKKVAAMLGAPIAKNGVSS